MPIYSKPVRVLIREMADELAKEPGSSFTRKDAVSWFARAYPKIKPGTVTAHLTKMATNARSRVHYNARPGEDDLFYQIDAGRFRLYRPGDDPTPIYDPDQPGQEGQLEEGQDEDESPSPRSTGEFAYEADLRNYLVKNLHALEPGLSVYEEEGISGVEFPVGGRYIDILATDVKGGLVVVELKVSRGYDRVVGQLMRYVAWVKKNLAEDGQDVRGMIVARQISEDLLLACSLVPGIKLYEYELSLALRAVDR